MRAARFTISTAYLAEVLDLPDGSTIIAATLTHPGHGIELVVDHPELPEHPTPTHCNPTVKRIQWDWGLPPVVKLDPGHLA